MSKARAYVFTINNYADSDVEALKAIECRYMIVGDEEGDEGTPHLQGYVMFTAPRSFNAIKKQMPRAHIEAAKGSPQQNVEYCSKQKILFEIGERPKQGRRTDVEHIREVVLDTNSIREVARQATSFQSMKMGEFMLKHLERSRDWEPKVYWFYGPSGAGKTTAAYEMFADDPSNRYVKVGKWSWWPRYDAHENVILDEFRLSALDRGFHELIELIGSMNYDVEYKGGHRSFLAKNIVITTPKDPYETCAHETEEIFQLIRRLTEVRYFPGRGEPSVVVYPKKIEPTIEKYFMVTVDDRIL